MRQQQMKSDPNEQLEHLKEKQLVIEHQRGDKASNKKHQIREYRTPKRKIEHLKQDAFNSLQIN